MERSRSCWVRPSDKEGLRASQAVFHPLPPFLLSFPLCACPRSLSSLVHSPVTLNRGLTFSRGHPWLAVKRSGINVRLEERVERGAWGGRSGVWSVVVNDWHSFWWSADMADSPSLFPPPPSLLSFCSSPCISLSLHSARLPGSSPLPPGAPTPLPSHPLWPYCFTSLHSGFYGCFVLVQTHLPTGWWVPPPVIAAIHYQRRSTSHFSDFGKMVFTLDHFTDSPYNTSSERLRHTRVLEHKVTQSEQKRHITILLCRFAWR